MNFYKHHIGDYAQATAHLSFVEDAAYSRMLRKYYAEEKPLPADLKAVQRLVGARTREEKEAVGLVLEEFFTLAADGWHNKRADAELGRANAQAEANRKVAEEREAKRRARAEAERSGNADSTNRGLSEHESLRRQEHESLPSREPSQTPDTRLQTENQERATATTVARPPPETDPPEANGQPPTAAGAVCRAMRRAGLADVNPGDPRLLALLAQGITEAEFVAVATEASAKGKGWPWALKVVQGRRHDAAAIAAAPPPAAPTPKAWADSRDGVINRACQLGMDAFDPTAAHYRTGPSWEQYRANVIAADQTANGATA